VFGQAESGADVVGGELLDDACADCESAALFSDVQIKSNAARSSPDMGNGVATIIQEVVTQGALANWERSDLIVSDEKLLPLASPGAVHETDDLCPAPDLHHLPVEEELQVLSIGRTGFSVQCESLSLVIVLHARQPV
jgi:hypothetical protein